MMKTDPPQKNPDLVYDVGMHKGEDTDFYLKKGFRVIAFEADPQLAEECRVRFKEKIQQGRLVIVEGAIVDCKAGDAEEKTVKFYRNRELSVWGTVDSVWASRNEAFGTSNEMIEIPSIDFSSCC